MGALKEKTIIYVTHQVEFLPAADLILVSEMPRKCSFFFFFLAVSKYFTMYVFLII